MRIYFVGSHATGKTTLCRYVSRRYGLPMISEVARAVLAEMETGLDALRTDMDLVEEYHFPVHYRLNSLRRIQASARAAGFSGVSFKCIEDPGMFVTYFPQRLRQLPGWYSGAVRRVGRPELYGTIVFRLDA